MTLIIFETRCLRLVYLRLVCEGCSILLSNDRNKFYETTDHLQQLRALFWTWNLNVLPGSFTELIQPCGPETLQNVEKCSRHFWLLHGDRQTVPTIRFSVSIATFLSFKLFCSDSPFVVAPRCLFIISSPALPRRIIVLLSSLCRSIWHLFWAKLENLPDCTEINQLPVFTWRH